MTRGKDTEVERWAKWMSTRHLPLTLKKPSGETTQALMECLLRPIQLWEFVCPKEFLDTVINSFNLFYAGNPFVSGYNINPKLWALRKMLGASPIPEPKNKTDKLLLPYEEFKNINVLGIGYKEDKEISELTHEAI